MKFLQCLAAGFLGAIVGALLLLFMHAQYADYRARAQSYEWLLVHDAYRREVAVALLRGGRAGDVPYPNMPPHNVARHSPADGVVVLQGGTDGQVIVFWPTLDNGVVHWHCVAGSAHAAPVNCQSMGQWGRHDLMQTPR